jgi:hypothetical protein
MVASPPGTPDDEPEIDGPRPFDHSSLEESLAEVLRAAERDAASGPPPGDLSRPEGGPPPPPLSPPVTDADAAPTGRADPFRSRTAVNHVGLRLPDLRPEAAVDRSEADGARSTSGLPGGAAGRPSRSDPGPEDTWSAPTAIPATLRLPVPPPGPAPDDDPVSVADRRDAPNDRATAGPTATSGVSLPAWRPEDDDILPMRRGRRRRGH